MCGFFPRVSVAHFRVVKGDDTDLRDLWGLFSGNFADWMKIRTFAPDFVISGGTRLPVYIASIV